MKNLEQLEQEAKQAREALSQELTEICGAILAKPLVDKIIEASVAMVTYQFALGMQEVSGDTQSLESYIEDSLKAKLRRNEEKFSENYLHGDGSGNALPEVSQEDAEVIVLMKEALKEIERNTCSHEETHRGGAIWEICDICGCKWADDEGGKPEFVEPKIVTDLRNYIEQSKSKEKIVCQEERDSDGWIDWGGGKCPVDKDTRVFVKLRDGVSSNICHTASAYRWNHADMSGLIDGTPQGDIIAYRIVKGE